MPKAAIAPRRIEPASGKITDPAMPAAVRARKVGDERIVAVYAKIKTPLVGVYLDGHFECWSSQQGNPDGRAHSSSPA